MTEHPYTTNQALQLRELDNTVGRWLHELLTLARQLHDAQVELPYVNQDDHAVTHACNMNCRGASYHLIEAARPLYRLMSRQDQDQITANYRVSMSRGEFLS